MAGELNGKVALVTGAARGQGRAHALRLAAAGADIIAVDVCAAIDNLQYPAATEADLRTTVKLVEELDRRIVSSVADIRDLDGLRTVVDQGVAELGRLDVVVANAGICIVSEWDRVTPEIFADTMAINVTGTWNTVTVSAPHLVAAGGGSVILISSAAGLKVQPFMVHYTTSKFAVRGMAKAFAAELAQHNVRVNSVHPTGVLTPMNSEELHVAMGAAIERNPRLGSMFANMLPVDAVEPEDVAETVLFLASDASRFITAHELAPDAGNTEM
jgi:SDR family mycofactocin-dependent oxidoreductase